MATRSTKILRTILLLTLLLVTLAVSALHYLKSWVETAVELRTGARVELGEYGLSFDQGTGLLFENLQVTWEEDRGQLSCRKALVSLFLWNRKEGQPLYRVRLVHPEGQIRLPLQKKLTAPNPAGPTDVFPVIPSGITPPNIEILGGSLRIDRGKNTLHLTDIELSNQYDGDLRRIRLSALLKQPEAPGEISATWLSPTGGPARQEELQVNLSKLHLSHLSAMLSDEPLPFSGTADFSLLARPTLLDELYAELSLEGEDVFFTAPSGTQVPLTPLRLQTYLGSQRNGVQFRQGVLKHGGITVQMEGTLGADGRLRTTLNTSPLPIKTLAEDLGASLPASLEEVARAAEISAEMLSFDISPPFDSRGLWPVSGSLHLHLAPKSLLPRTPPVALNASVHFTPHIASLTGEVKLPELDGPARLALSGNLTPKASAQLLMEGPLTVAELLAPHLSKDILLKGDVQTHARLSLSQGEQSARIELDLSALEFVHKGRIWKKAQIPTKAVLNLSPRDAAVEAEAEVEMGGIHLKGAGQISRTQNTPWEFELWSESLPLEKVATIAPALERIALSGEADLQLVVKKGPEPNIETRGDLVFRNAAGRVPGPTADVRSLNGRVEISDATFSGRNLEVKFEHSEAKVSARLELVPAFSLELDVRSPKILASELVFRSDQHFLQNLHGKLRIDREGILFNEIRFEMPDGTRASVNGYLENFRKPLVFLDVDAPYARVETIIALFTGPGATKSHLKHRGRIQPYIHVISQAAEGHLNTLAYKKLSSSVIYDQGELTVYPLRFHSGPGYFVGRVHTDLRERQDRSLSVAGHLEAFELADVLDYLGVPQKVMDGSLSATFNLRGGLGTGRFVDSLRGGIHLRADEGTLYRFQVLSKIFSLLNVSQLVQFKLPEMSSRGMPYNYLEGNIAASEGVLHSEDLFLDSEAMNFSLIGETDLKSKQLDALLGIKPLKTVDKIVTNIPLAGWLLAGEERALVTAHFKLEGSLNDPSVRAVPITSVSEKVVGILKRIFGLPGKIISDINEATQKESTPP